MNKRNEIIPIMHCFDNNFVIPAAVSFYSMLKNADRRFIYRLYVLHSDITTDNQRRLIELVSAFDGCTLEFIDTNNKFEDLYRKWGIGTTFTKEMLYKIIAPDVFSQYDKIIITDVDVVFERDISEEYLRFDVSENGKDKDMYIAGEGRYTKTYISNFHSDKTAIEMKNNYFQVLAGYLIMNCKKMREDEMTKKMTEYAYEHIHEFSNPEQDLMNICLSPKIKILPPETLVCAGEYDDGALVGKTNDEIELIKLKREHPLQIHYSMKNLKPWDNVMTPKWEVWFDYLRKTSFYFDWLRNVQNMITISDSLIPVFQIKIPRRERYFSLFFSRIREKRITRMLNTEKKELGKI